MIGTSRSNNRTAAGHSGRHHAYVAIPFVFAALLLLAFATSAPPVGAVSPNDVTIEFTPSGAAGDCVPVGQSLADGTLAVTAAETEAAFVVTIQLSADLCDPVDAKAAIYKMPDSGSWPQTLATVRSFEVKTAGTTVVTFAKGCERVQFDLHTQGTPDWIHPDVVMHGPLLTPNAALQFFGSNECEATTTTTTIATSTSVVPTPTSVAGSTTIANVTTTTAAPTTSGATTTTEAPVVLGATAVRPPASGQRGAVSGTPLAVTGSGVQLGYLGAVALVAGGLLVAATQRHRRSAA